MSLHIGCEAHGGSALARGEDGSAGRFLDVFKKLGFRSTGVSAQKHVDVTADFVFAAYSSNGRDTLERQAVGRESALQAS